MTLVLSDDQLSSIHLLLDRIRARQLQDFGQIGSDVKPDGSLITDCDRWSDAALVEGLASIAPGEGVLSEEGSKTVPNTRAYWVCLLYTSPSPRDGLLSRMPSSA